MPLKDLTKIISIRTMLQKSKLYDISKTTKSFQYKWGALISLWLILVAIGTRGLLDTCRRIIG